jgi:hypothetical protein
MPENVRTQELPGLLKRYKDGVPGWELKAVDLDSVIGQRPAVSREELLQAVKERSPVYTHGEVMLGDKVIPGESERRFIDRDRELGGSQFPGDTPRFEEYGQGGKDYRELLLTQDAGNADNPLRGAEYGNHWKSKTSYFGNTPENVAVAHARFDTHGDALRINELQSDLGIHNRKVREAIASHKGPPAQLPSESDSAYLDRVQEQGYVVQMSDDGEWTWVNDPNKQGIQFPLEDAWSDLLIKRLALEAARKGHRAIEVASPRAIADKVGGNIDNYEHFYGKVVPGALERLGRKMGGLVEDAPTQQSRNRFVPSEEDLLRVRSEGRDMIRDEVFAQQGDPFVGSPFWKLYDELQQSGHSSDTAARAADMFGGYVLSSPPRGQSEIAADMYKHFVGLGYTPQQAQRVVGRALLEAPQEMRQKIRYTAAIEADQNARPEKVLATPGRRYLMSDEMRRRLIEGGVGAAVATGIMSQDDLINRLNP